MFTEAEFAERFVAALCTLQDEDRTYEFRVESGVTGKPRASSLGSCARQQYYKLTKTPVTESVDVKTGKFSPWSALMGHAGQSLAELVLQRMGYTITVRGLPDDLPYSGHIDGILSGLDLEKPALWDSKIRSEYGVRQLATKSVKQTDLEMYMQMQAYMKALHLTYAVLTVIPHSLSSMRQEMSRYKLDIPSVQVTRVIIEADSEAQDILTQRAIDLAAAQAMGVMVHREFNPVGKEHAVFPCGWCEWRTQCMVDEFIEEQITVTPLPVATVDLEAA